MYKIMHITRDGLASRSYPKIVMDAMAIAAAKPMPLNNPSGHAEVARREKTLVPGTLTTVGDVYRQYYVADCTLCPEPSDYDKETVQLIDDGMDYLFENLSRKEINVSYKIAIIPGDACGEMGMEYLYRYPPIIISVFVDGRGKIAKKDEHKTRAKEHLKRYDAVNFAFSVFWNATPQKSIKQSTFFVDVYSDVVNDGESVIMYQHVDRELIGRVCKIWTPPCKKLALSDECICEECGQLCSAHE